MVREVKDANREVRRGFGEPCADLGEPGKLEFELERVGESGGGDELELFASLSRNSTQRCENDFSKTRNHLVYLEILWICFGLPPFHLRSRGPLLCPLSETRTQYVHH